jgi:hypothetical protein
VLHEAIVHGGIRGRGCAPCGVIYRARVPAYAQFDGCSARGSERRVENLDAQSAGTGE